MSRTKCVVLYTVQWLQDSMQDIVNNRLPIKTLVTQSIVMNRDRRWV